MHLYQMRLPASYPDRLLRLRRPVFRDFRHPRIHGTSTVPLLDPHIGYVSEHSTARHPERLPTGGQQGKHPS